MTSPKCCCCKDKMAVAKYVYRMCDCGGWHLLCPLCAKMLGAIRGVGHYCGKPPEWHQSADQVNILDHGFEVVTLDKCPESVEVQTMLAFVEHERKLPDGCVGCQMSYVSKCMVRACGTRCAQWKEHADFYQDAGWCQNCGHCKPKNYVNDMINLVNAGEGI